MDNDQKATERKPIIDQMTDMAAEAAGNLAETGVRAAAKKTKQVIAERLPSTVKEAGKTITKAASARATKKRASRVRAAAKKATKAVAKRIPKPVKKAGRSLARTASARTSKKTATRGARKTKAKRR